jgi:hypothetical protein
VSEEQSEGARRPLQVKIEIPADLEANYANLAVISHSLSEMIIDFAQLLPQQPKARVRTRVVMTPLNAKLLHRALGENISKYEAQFGEIEVPTQGPTLAQQFFNLNPPNPEGDE